MFDINNKYRLDTDIPIISDNYHVFHYDEFPILFSGTNGYGNHVIGSLCATNEDEDVLRYLHIIVKSNIYTKFIKQSISYRDLVDISQKVFLIDQSINNELIQIFNVPKEVIPADYLPMPDIFCPNVGVAVGFDFMISLKGKLADIHEAITDTVSAVSTGVHKVFDKIISNLAIPGQQTTIHQLAPTASSFGINFRIKQEHGPNLFYSAKNDHQIADFIVNYIDYSLNYLAQETPTLISDQPSTDSYVSKVEKPLEEIFISLHTKFDDANRTKLLKSTLEIPSELEKITEQLGKGFEFIEIKTVQDIDQEKFSTLGVIDKEFSDSIRVASEIIEGAGSEIENDDELKNYRIQIYHLSRTSRKGNAFITNDLVEGKETLDKPKIAISGKTELENSIFTESLHEGKWIEVRAKAKRVNGRFSFLTIEF